MWHVVSVNLTSCARLVYLSPVMLSHALCVVIENSHQEPVQIGTVSYSYIIRQVVGSGPALSEVRSHRRYALDIRRLHPANQGGKGRWFHEIVPVCLLVPRCDREIRDSRNPFSLWRGAPICADPESDPDYYQREDDALAYTSYSMFGQIGNILTINDVSCDMNSVRWFSTGYDRQTERTKSSMMYCALLPEAYAAMTEIKAEEYKAPDSITITMTGKSVEFMLACFISC